MRNHTRRVLARRAAAVAAGGLVAVAALAGSAAELTFRVPDEEARAATVKLRVKVPTGHPIAQLLISPVLPGQFQDFSVSADPLPSGISQLDFKAVQTYSNGDVVRWIDLAQPGEPAPAHPAPVLILTAGS